MLEFWKHNGGAPDTPAQRAQMYLYFLDAFLLSGVRLLLNGLAAEQGFQCGAF